MSKRTLFSADNMMALLEKENRKGLLLERELFSESYETRIHLQIYKKIIVDHRRITDKKLTISQYQFEGTLIKYLNAKSRYKNKKSSRNISGIESAVLGGIYDYEKIQEAYDTHIEQNSLKVGEEGILDKENINTILGTAFGDSYKKFYMYPESSEKCKEKLHEFYNNIKEKYEKNKGRAVDMRRLFSSHINQISKKREENMKTFFEPRCQRLSEGQYDLEVTENDMPERYDKPKKSYSLKIHLAGYPNRRKQKKDPFTFLCSRQLQKNLQIAYRVKQADRHKIIKQLKKTLDNRVPKVIIKLDIKSFYESISFDYIMQRLRRDKLISYTSMDMLDKLKSNYHGDGIPRGIGISPYLAEWYMKDFDKVIKEDSSVVFYSRYVDDIIIVLKGCNYIDTTNCCNLEIMNTISIELSKKTYILIKIRKKLCTILDIVSPKILII